MFKFSKFNINRVVNGVVFSLFIFWTFAAIFYILGSYIEDTYFKVRINQRVENVTYNKQTGYLCWDWYSDKVRAKAANNMGVTLTDNKKTEVLLTTFGRDDKQPWTLSNPVPVGNNRNQPLCTFIPPGYAPATPFKVNQYVQYPGFLGIWNITTKLPEITITENIKSN